MPRKKQTSKANISVGLALMIGSFTIFLSGMESLYRVLSKEPYIAVPIVTMICGLSIMVVSTGLVTGKYKL